MKRMIMVFVLCITMLMPMTISAAITDPGTSIVPCWEYMNDMDVHIAFSGTTGTATGTVDRILGVTSEITGTLYVYRKVGNSWVFVDSETKTTSNTFSVEVSFDAVKGTEYKAIFRVTAYGSGGSETDSTSTTKICPSN
ncbi:MAG: hypothetical protein E7604_03770 [Ruminococcaceae bacterium]|nr:hypothetical protein [Oscillospiraceae bacterium]